jgi:hypothetical protein
VFYFQQLLNQGLAGIDRTSMVAVMVGISYTVLLIGFLLGLYQAALRGGDLRTLGVTAIKYLVVALILANWSTVFREVNGAFNAVAQSIDSASGAGDMFASWMDQLNQQFQSNGSTYFWSLIQGGPAALITVLLVFVAYLIYALAVIVFGFFYTLYGCVLYVVGPVVLALMPLPGVGQIAKTFASNVLIWNSWALLYAIFGSMITALQANRIEDILNGSGFLGFFAGNGNSMVLGLISIFYALALMLIPFIAQRIISGDVGSTASALVRAGASALGIAIAAGEGIASGIAGAAAGGGAGAAGGGGGAGAGGGGSSAGGSSSGAGAGGAGAASSSAAPPQPSLAGTIRSGMMSAVDGGAPPAPSSGSSGGDSSGGDSSGGQDGGTSSSSTKSQSSQGSFRPSGVGQQLAFRAGRFAGRAANKVANGAKEDEDA